MYQPEHAAARQRATTIMAEVEQARMAGRIRKLRKRDGRVTRDEAGDRRPPALNC